MTDPACCEPDASRLLAPATGPPRPDDDSTIVASVEVAPGVVLDYNQADQVVGVEMLRLSNRSPNLDLSALQFEAV